MFAAGGENMYQNIMIEATGIYVPPRKVYNDFFIEHFRKYGIETERLLKHLGRRKRYFAAKGENALTMGCEAAKNVLEKANIGADEIDMIVFASDTPEYTFPTNALKINHMIGAKRAHTVFDVNCNCIGMLTAIDVASRYAQSKSRVKNILIVGSLLISSIVNRKDSIVYPTFADSAAAVVLRNVNEEQARGFIDSTVYTDSNYHNSILMPACGNSNLHVDSIREEKKILEWNPFDFSFLSDNWSTIINRLLERNDVTPEQIDYFVFSQFSNADNLLTLEKLGVSRDKYIFVGNEYGYTGVTSPILALDKCWDRVSKPGNKIVFCSVAAGYSMTALYYKF